MVIEYAFTASQPLPLTIDGALDGISHGLEVLMGISENQIKKAMPVCLTGIELLVNNLKKTVADPGNMEARESIGLGTDLGGYAIMIGGTNGAHLNSFSLTDILSHGRACALMNPYYVVFFSPNIENRLRVVGRIYKNAGYTVGANVMFSDRRDGYPVARTEMLRQIPPYGSRYNDDGVTLRYSPTNDPMSSINPDFDLQYIDRRQVTRTWTNNLYAKIKLPFEIGYEFNFAPRYEYFEYMNHQSALHPDWGLSGGMADRNTSQLYGWEMNNIIRWKKTIEKIHHFEVTLLQGAEQRQFWSENTSAQGFSPSDVLGYHRMQAGSSSTYAISSNDEYSTAATLMGRLFYTFNEKYMLTFSVRRDGYSAFGANHPWGLFPSLALGWVFTEEKIMKNDILTYGKLRLSYGDNGNRDIGIYDWLSNMSTGKYPYQPISGSAYESSYLYVSRMANANLKWEKKRSYNIGLDFGIKNDLFTGSIDVIKRVPLIYWLTGKCLMYRVSHQLWLIWGKLTIKV